MVFPAIFWLISAYMLHACTSHIYHIPSAVSNRSSTAHFISTASGLDSPKVHPVNASAFEWWYFDVVSNAPGSLASLAVTFYTTTANAFPLLEPSNTVTLVRTELSFPNGTLWTASLPAHGATVVTDDDHASRGDWHNSGFKWTQTREEGYLRGIRSSSMHRRSG